MMVLCKCKNTEFKGLCMPNLKPMILFPAQDCRADYRSPNSSQTDQID